MTDEPIDILKEAAALLAQCRTASLATVDTDGHAHAANIQYVHDDSLNLYFVSSEDAAHSRHIARNPAVALTVYHHDDTRPETIRGLQLHGRVEAVTVKHESADELKHYLSKFHFIADDPTLCAALEQQTFYRLTPTWLRLIDNRRGFGWKAEMEFG